MKYTRVELKDGFSKHKIIICFAIILPIVAFLVGKILVNYAGKDLINKGNELKNFNSVYYLQLGVYEKEKGAKDKEIYLKDKGINSIVLKENSQYVVISYLSSSDKKLEERKKELESKGVPTYIKDIKLESVTNNTLKEYKNILKQYIFSSLNRKSDLMESSYDTIQNYKVLDKSYVKLQEETKSLIRDNFKLDYEKNKKDYYKNILQIILNYNKIV